MIKAATDVDRSALADTIAGLKATLRNKDELEILERETAEVEGDSALFLLLRSGV